MYHHHTGSASHDLCRAHSYCSLDGQYFSRPCSVCYDLWERASNIDAPEGAIRAYDTLEEWILGFRENSRYRAKGTDFFLDPDERGKFQDLSALIANVRYIPALDDPVEPSFSVSIPTEHIVLFLILKPLFHCWIYILVL